VPRHFERAEAVRRDLRSLGLDPVLKTELGENPASIPPPAPNRCLVVNTTGELWAWYHLADIVLIGKTFLSDEGQNPIEPILAGKPVITGPVMKNFASLAERLNMAAGAPPCQTQVPCLKPSLHSFTILTGPPRLSGPGTGWF